jgi:hypothetical protein
MFTAETQRHGEKTEMSDYRALCISRRLGVSALKEFFS